MIPFKDFKRSFSTPGAAANYVVAFVPGSQIVGTSQNQTKRKWDTRDLREAGAMAPPLSPAPRAFRTRFYDHCTLLLKSLEQGTNTVKVQQFVSFRWPIVTILLYSLILSRNFFWNEVNIRSRVKASSSFISSAKDQRERNLMNKPIKRARDRKYTGHPSPKPVIPFILAPF